ncbi:MAG TPA: hypothetical protein VLN56_08590 [Gammaproteobacteria bacterium]|nr:hypothetical protein [Gammaproteobacteria bacterium]
MEERPHSRLGIASFILSILLFIITFILLGIAGVMEASTPGGIDETATNTIILGLAIIAVLFIDLVALVLGICGMVQKERKKIFAGLGSLLSGILLVGTILVIIIGNSMA